MYITYTLLTLDKVSHIHTEHNNKYTMIHQSESLTSLLAHNLSLDARSLSTPCHKMHPQLSKFISLKML